jgi:hypothetical protein
LRKHSPPHHNFYSNFSLFPFVVTVVYNVWLLLPLNEVLGDSSPEVLQADLRFQEVVGMI